MFSLNYNRRPTITYRRKPRIETLQISSDDDSDLDEPEKIRSPLQQYKGNSISIVGEHAHLLDTQLDQNVFEEKSSSSNEAQPTDNHFQQPTSHEQPFPFIDETIVQESSHSVPPIPMAPVASVDTPSIAPIVIPPIVPTQAIQTDEQLEIVPSNADPFITLCENVETIAGDQNIASDLAASASQTGLDAAWQPSFDIFDFPELPIPSAAPLAPPPKADSKPSFDIFDFPTEEDTGTVKLMVASRKQALKRSLSQVASAPRPPQRPSSALKGSKSEAHEPKRVRFAMDSLVSTFHRTSLDLSRPVTIPTAEDSSEIMPAAAPAPLKPKRNLVSRLRGATGQASAPTLRKYNFGEEDEDEEHAMADASPRLAEDEEGHRERMERELVAIMENEFGNSEQENRERPQYQPKNAMNVRVTYHSKKAPLSSHQDREMLELDSLLERLRAESSHL